MFFGELTLAEAEGCLLAHSLDSSGGRVRKGTRLDADLLRALGERGHERVVVARLDVDDEHEDAAAARLAAALVADDAARYRLRLSRASTGRVNLFARESGLFVIERESLLAANRVDEGITVATLGENVAVIAGRLVATVKIIPFAVPRRLVDDVIDGLRRTAGSRGATMALAPFRPRTAALVHTTLPALRDSVVDKTSRITRARLAARGFDLVHESRCAHAPAALENALTQALATASSGGREGEGPDLLLIVGASAISDRRDVIPAAIVRAGGTIRRFGLPVDPGNLLLIGELAGRPVLGLPGCARSPRDNGLDRVLDRIAGERALDETWLQSLAVGGLLGEIVERPSPRDVAAEPPSGDEERRERVAGLLLAAGASRRAAPFNKLLYPVGGEPMVRRIARRLLESEIDDLTVVTGHDAPAVAEALEGLGARLVHNPAHAGGMAGSLSCGLGTLLDRDAVLVCLGDMPAVSAVTVGRLIAAWRALPAARRPRAIVLPVADGRRGNPVLFGRAFFDLMLALEGDAGARALVRAHPDAVEEVAIEDTSVLIDHDTPEALRTLDEP